MAKRRGRRAETAAALGKAKRREPDAEAPATEHRAAEPERKRFTFYLPTELVEEARDAAYKLQATPLRATLAGIVEEAIRRELERLKQEHNSGRNFRRRPESARRLKAGRRMDR